MKRAPWIALGTGLATFALAAPAPARTIHLSPSGSDSASGGLDAPLRTLGAAWRRVPAGRTAGWKLVLAPGDYRDGAPNYWERKAGPIPIEGPGGRARPVLPEMNVFRVDRLTVRGLRLEGGGDVFHCERCRRLLLDDLVLRGDGAQETIKINQSSDVTVRGSDVAGAGDNAFDAVAVQGLKLEGNHFHDAGDWCAYAKGGSTKVVVRGNLFSECGTGGFTAGQGTGLQFMTWPFVHYEASSVLVEDNSVRDTEGAAFGVNGAANVLLRNNVATRVGSRSHVLEVVYGGRSCDGRPGDAGRSRCASYLRRSGWGTAAVDDGDNFVRVPNFNVLIYGNVILNPDGATSRWQVFQVAGGRSGPAGGVPRGLTADTGLRIAGNVIWDGGPDHPLGLGEESCGAGSSCSPATVQAANEINTRRPEVEESADGRLRVTGWAAQRAVPTPPPPSAGARVAPEPRLWTRWP